MNDLHEEKNKPVTPDAAPDSPEAKALADELASQLAELNQKLAEEMKTTKVGDEIQYPLEVSKLKILRGVDLFLDHTPVGTPVAVRVCGEEATYFGIFLGNLPVEGFTPVYHTEKKELTIVSERANPAIYVPDLARVVRGYESWWGAIQSEEDLKQITDDTINQQWYVRAMKALAEREAAKKPTPEPTPEPAPQPEAPAANESQETR